MPLVRNPIGTGTRITLLVSRMKEEVWTFSNTPEEEFMNDGDLTIDAQVTANNQALASRLVQMVKDEFGQEGYDLAHSKSASPFRATPSFHMPSKELGVLK